MKFRISLVLLCIAAITTTARAQNTTPPPVPSPSPTSTTGGRIPTVDVGYAFPPRFDHAAHAPCPCLLDQERPGSIRGLTPDRGSQIHSVCRALGAEDWALGINFGGSIAYTAVAAVCWTACAAGATPAGAWAVPVCQYGQLGVSLADTAAQIMMLTQAMGDQQEALTGRTALYGANTVAAATSLCSVGCPMLFGSISRAGAQSTTQAGAQSGASSSSQSGASQSARQAACVSAVFTTIVATAKWATLPAIEGLARNEEKKIDELLRDIPDRSCYRPDNRNNNGNSLSRNDEDQGPLVMTNNAITGSQPDANRRVRTNQNYNPSLQNLSTAATADNGTGLGAGTQHMLPEALEGLQNNMGVSPQQIADSLASGQSPSDVLAKVLPDAADAIKEVDTNKESLAKEMKLDSNSLYASAGGGKGHGGDSGMGLPDLSSLFGGLKKDGTAGAGAGASSVQFGKLEPLSGDIWHIGTKKSIFEIVSDRWTSVVKRFMREDGEQHFMAHDPHQHSSSPQRSPSSATPRQ